VCGENKNIFFFLSNCWKCKICNSRFIFATARDMEFEMPSELKTGTAQRRRIGKRIKKM
jgi:hypothetical protein